MNRAGRLLALALGLGFVPPSAAQASPSRWALAREPALYEELQGRHQVEAAAVKDLVRRKRRATEPPDPLDDPGAPHRLALSLLSQARAAESPRPLTRLALALTLHALDRFADAARLLEGLVGPGTLEGPFRAHALAELAIAHAREGRQEQEIEVYHQAIALEPHGRARATMIANQAEGFMVLGDVDRAIRGYRAALDSVDSNQAMHQVAPTTLWSLGVALDRSGDLPGALDSIALARVYDPNDRQINGPSWFFVPEHESDYYAALGHWLQGRRAAEIEDRLGGYERAVLSFSSYIERAPAHDHYLPVARARLKAVSKEFAEVQKKATTPTPIDPTLPP